MRAVVTISLLCIFFMACRQNSQLKSIETDSASVAATHKDLPVQRIDTSARNAIHQSTIFPGDTIYEAEILFAGGTYHEDEVQKHFEDYNWKGLFKDSRGYYLADTKLLISKAHDAILDGDGEKTGWDVNANSKDSSILFIANLNYLNNADVPHVKLTRYSLLPGENETFIYNGIEYKLYATGKKQLTGNTGDNYIITDYKLFLSAKINDKYYRQLLVDVTAFDDNLTTILFIGDIDKDGYIDMVIDTSNDYNAEVPTLYLSMPAIPTQLLKVVGMHTYVGC